MTPPDGSMPQDWQRGGKGRNGQKWMQDQENNSATQTSYEKI
jgi:hypothetical protein